MTKRQKYIIRFVATNIRIKKYTKLNLFYRKVTMENEKDIDYLKLYGDLQDEYNRSKHMSLKDFIFIEKGLNFEDYCIILQNRIISKQRKKSWIATGQRYKILYAQEELKRVMADQATKDVEKFLKLRDNHIKIIGVLQDALQLKVNSVLSKILSQEDGEDEDGNIVTENDKKDSSFELKTLINASQSLAEGTKAVARIIIDGADDVGRVDLEAFARKLEEAEAPLKDAMRKSERIKFDNQIS